MMISENIRLAFSSLRANKMRALLTMLGIIIGIASVIAIITLGDSLTSSISSEMQGMGANDVTLYLQQKDSDTQRQLTGIDSRSLMTDEMLDELRAAFSDEIEAISISNTVGNGKTTDGADYANLNLVGVNEDFVRANKLTLEAGRNISGGDIQGSKKVAVVSDKLAAKMFPGQDPLAQQITVKVGKHIGTYTIVGVYKYEQQSFGGMTVADVDVVTDVYIPLTTAQRITGVDGYQMVTLLTTTTADTKTMADRVSAFFNRYYVHDRNYKVSAFSMESMLETVTTMLANVQLAIAAIAAISLLVGGIGVMNIMLVSITERTREIGTRKALGATNGEIRTQFIIEAMIICLVGGVIGIILGVMMGTAGASLLGAPAKASPSTMLATATFSMVIGVFFGYYPANKAAKLDPIDALRYE